MFAALGVFFHWAQGVTTSLPLMQTRDILHRSRDTDFASDPLDAGKLPGAAITARHTSGARNGRWRDAFLSFLSLSLPLSPFPSHTASTHTHTNACIYSCSLIFHYYEKKNNTHTQTNACAHTGIHYSWQISSFSTVNCTSEDQWCRKKTYRMT